MSYRNSKDRDNVLPVYCELGRRGAGTQFVSLMKPVSKYHGNVGSLCQELAVELDMFHDSAPSTARFETNGWECLLIVTPCANETYNMNITVQPTGR